MEVHPPFEATDPTAAPSREERLWALTAHVGPLVASLLSAGLLAFAVPLVIFFVCREDSPFATDQAKEALNFRITLFLAYAICFPFLFMGVGFCIWPVIFLAELVFSIVAAIQAYDGRRYRYPCTIRLIG